MELVDLKSAANVITGFPFKSEFYGNEGIRTVRGENITEGKLRWDSIKCWDEPFDKTEYYSLKENDIVIGMDGSKVGKNKARIRKIDLPLLLAQRVACIRAKKNYNQIFLFYCINNSRLEDYVSRIQTGSSVPHISKTQIEDFKIPNIKLSIQNQIAKVLSDLDAKIEVNNKINEELEALAKTIYEYWFVQFDFPDANGKPYKSSGGKMVFNEKLKREIPLGWQDKTIADWIERDKSGDWGKDSKQGNYTEKVSCIRGADINGLNGNGEVKAPERFILEKNTHKLLEHGDLIIEISGGSPTQSTGRMAFITQETLERFNNPLICSNFCKAVTLKDETYLYNFVYQWNRIYDAGVLFGWEGKTSGIKNLLFESFVTNYKTVFPQKNIVEKFYQKVKPLHAKKQKNLQENQKLAELRDWLLPMLMNGQVTVKEAKEHIDQAAEPQENYG
ncbi:restriction endonuclease subunit S [Arenibacter sp. S6351L]|uniref:restriction endonuclease subunit S n=1 Tax=Arenibacter sp. S6351L TaxID=2926407 RepID=UPI001FF461DB|nr:restriction endonuclease subunit S [Arenibacter sp. S6351L]MCK0137300.1 restriction endonuclease subunit S [Arenibacter sp. S6351L]